MRKAKVIFIMTALLLGSFNSVFATAQMPDILIYEGKEESIFTNPLESYFGGEHPRPEGLFKFSCTANWRGYMATWEIKEGSLYLVKIVEGTCSMDAPEIPVSGIFPGKKAPVLADWYSGSLRIPQGELLSYTHMGYESVYEKELVLEIKSGKLVNKATVKNTAPGPVELEF